MPRPRPLLLAVLSLGLALPSSAVAPDPADVRTALGVLRTDTEATVPDAKVQGKLVKAVDKALAKLTKADAAPTEKKATKGYKKTRNGVRGYLKKLGWKEKKGLLKPKKKQKVEAEVADPLRDQAAAILALLDALIEGVDEAPASGVVGPLGGTVVSEDGLLELVFPEGALPEQSAIVTIRPLDPATLGPGFDGLEIDTAWDLGPDDLEFDEPVVVSSLLDEAPRQEDGGIAASGLPLLYVSSDREAALLEDLQLAIDGIANRTHVRGSLSHFSTLGEVLAPGSPVRWLLEPLPDDFKAIGETFTTTLSVEVEATESVGSLSASYTDATQLPLSSSTPEGRHELGSHVFSPTLGGFLEQSITYTCMEPGGMGLVNIFLVVVVAPGGVPPADPIEYEISIRWQVVCETARAPLGETPGSAGGVSDLTFSVDPTRVPPVPVDPPKPPPPDGTFLVRLEEILTNVRQPIALGVRISDFRPGVVSRAVLEESFGDAEADLSTNPRAGFASQFLQIPDDFTPISDGRYRQNLRFTCESVGPTALVFDVLEIACKSGSTPPCGGFHFDLLPRASLITLVSCVAATAEQLPDHDEDREPNNTPETAEDVGQLPPNSERRVGGSIGDGDAVDYFVATLTETSDVRLTPGLPFAPAAEVEHQIWNDAQENIGCATPGGAVDATDVAPGNVLFVVTQTSGDAGSHEFSAWASDAAGLARGTPVSCESPLCENEGDPCGSSGAGICVEGQCIVEVPMNAGTSGDDECAAEGLACTGVPVFASPPAGCLAFHPGASVSSDLNGWAQSVWCDNDTGLACEGRVNDCHDCPLCGAGLDCTQSSSDLLSSLFAACQ